MKRVPAALVLVLGAALLGAACSGTPAETTTTTQAPPATVAAETSTTVVTTTTTTTSTTTTGAPNPTGRASGVIGIVGCSNSAMAAAGYDVVSNLDYLTQGGLTGGSVAVWGNPGPARYGRYWGMYDDRRPATGYTGTWFQLCIRTTEHNGSFNADIKGWIEHVVGQIQERDPGIPIWISPVNTYADGLVCPTIGENGAAIAAEAADWAAENIPGVERGPDLGPIHADELDLGEQCHPNLAGQSALGEQLVEFFD